MTTRDSMATCVACEQPFEPGLVLRNAWGQRIHRTCSPPLKCAGCQAWILPKRDEQLPDGRRMCPPCLLEGVVRPEQATPLLEETVRVVRALGLGVDASFPIQVVDQTGLLPLTGDRRALGHTVTRPAGKGRREVTRIVLASHLRPAHFRGVAAHELTHAYLHQRVPARLPRAVSEGLCNYVASRVYQAAPPDPVAAFHLGQLESDPDPHYGEGYRRVRDALGDDDATVLNALASLEAGVVPKALSPSVGAWARGRLRLALRRSRGER